VLVGGKTVGTAPSFRGLHLGTVAYDRMPDVLGTADVGVAPYDTARLAQLRLGFYWSPLKIFEYMAAGLPVVAPAVDRIPSLVADAREGILYDPADPAAPAGPSKHFRLDEVRWS